MKKIQEILLYFVAVLPVIGLLIFAGLFVIFYKNLPAYITTASTNVGWEKINLNPALKEMLEIEARSDKSQGGRVGHLWKEKNFKKVKS